jgi:hypothetical protein
MSVIQLGILASSGGAPADYELIATAYGTGSSRVIDFTGIPGTYKHLQVRYTAKNSGSNVDIAVTLNNVTSSSYATHAILTDGSSLSSTNTTSATSMNLIDASSSNGTANSYCAGIIDIVDYANTAKNTTIKALYGKAEASRKLHLVTGFINSTSAINQVTLTGGAGNFTTASRFSLYGIKG